MASILILILGLVLMLISAVFSGWVYSVVYDLAVVPILGCLPGVCAPDIPFNMFILLSLGIAACTAKLSSTDKETYATTDGKFWAKWLGAIFAKLCILFLLWIVNMNIF